VVCGMKRVLERCSKGKKLKVSLLQKSNSVLPCTSIFVMAQQPLVGRDLSITEASRSNSHTPHSRELLLPRDQPDAKTSTCNTQHSKETSIPPAGFETTIPASERPQTHILDLAATGIGLACLYLLCVISIS